MEGPDFYKEDAAGHVNGAMLYLITEIGRFGGLGLIQYYKRHQ